MTRLITLILYGILFFDTAVKAEITYMNCKFNEGWHKKGTTRADVNKMPDLSISWDKDKKVIKVTDRNFEPYRLFKDTIFWSHKWSDWNDDYTLNTINGNLHMSGFNKKENWENSFYYTCDKTQKKF